MADATDRVRWVTDAHGITRLRRDAIIIASGAIIAYAAVLVIGFVRNLS